VRFFQASDLQSDEGGTFTANLDRSKLSARLREMADATTDAQAGLFIRVVVKRVLQPIGYFVAAVCLLVMPFAVAEGWPRVLLIAIFIPPACLAVWLGIEVAGGLWRSMEDD
jgi:hypothetical protein